MNRKKTNIKCVPGKEGYGIIPNSFSQDRSISLTTKAVLLDSFSRPENWETSVSGLMSVNGICRNVARKVLKEAEEFGYLFRVETRINGRFSGYDIFISPDKKSIEEIKKSYAQSDSCLIFRNISPDSSSPEPLLGATIKGLLQSKDNNKIKKEKRITSTRDLKLEQQDPGEVPQQIKNNEKTKERILSTTDVVDFPQSRANACGAEEKSIAQSALDLYNDLASKVGLQKARILSQARKRAVMARISEVGSIEEFKQALRNVERSAFLQGRNDRGWKADFDFICQAKSFHRLYEGGYGNGAHSSINSPTGRVFKNDDDERNARIMERL